LGIVLAGVVILTAIFSYSQTSKAASLMEDFKNFIPKMCQVKRDGVFVPKEAVHLVPGDIIKISGGD
jgi:magnesium-transporting ATPase (P-type)